MEQKAAFDAFARDFIKYCLDDTVISLPQNLSTGSVDKNNFSLEEVKEIYENCAHKSIANFLYLFDQKREYYSIVIHAEGAVIDLVEESDGVVGELYGDNGWIARFSTTGR